MSESGGRGERDGFRPVGDRIEYEIDRPVFEMRRRDAAAAISVHVGRRPPKSQTLPKSTLNSVHRYLTGEFSYKPGLYDTPFSTELPELRAQIVNRLASEGYDHFAEMARDPDTRWDRPFQRDTLRELLVALRDHSDERPPG